MFTRKFLFFSFIFFFSSYSDAIRIIDPHLYINDKKNHVQHECGLAMVYLRKPLIYYQNKYQDQAWGLQKTWLLLSKQRNRGQDGAGIAMINPLAPSGMPVMKRIRICEPNAIEHLFNRIADYSLHDTIQSNHLGSIYLGHIRYGTYGNDTINYCQPHFRKNKRRSFQCALAGNFNMANTQELEKTLIELGIIPTADSDTHLIIELLGHYLDLQSNNNDSMAKILAETLRNVIPQFDGGYALSIILGDGTACVVRDKFGIRPCFYYADSEIVAVASERIALSTVFNKNAYEIHEITPGSALMIEPNGNYYEEKIIEAEKPRQCSFERIYFSRGNDPDIYRERKLLGKYVAPRVMQALHNTIENTVFTYIPNTSEIAFLGMVEEIERLNKEFNNTNFVKIEKTLYKDQFLRTFIVQDKQRQSIVNHAYDITPTTVSSEDTLVVIDDSIVRGTTLREAIIKQLAKLNPKRIIIVSASPPVLYPDCYGIDMSQIGQFVGFQAMIEILNEHGEGFYIKKIYEECLYNNRCENHIKKLYNKVTLDALEKKIAQLIRSNDLTWDGEIIVIYQTLQGLALAMPHYTGDWYFTGNYPTPAGYRVVNKSFINWCDGTRKRAY